jgi:flagellin-like hook-associated protein FlgL
MVMRLATANTYDQTIATLTTRAAERAAQTEKVSSGKKIIRASDDPTGAAQAERAMTRSARVDTETRALNLQKNTVSLAEGTLGQSVDLLNAIRDLLVNAGDGALTGEDRSALALQIQNMRDQLFGYANTLDSNGVPIFGGLASASTAFTDSAGGLTFNGITGSRASTLVSVPGTMDGQAVWMDVPTGNGVFVTGLGTNALITSTNATVPTEGLLGSTAYSFTSPTVAASTTAADMTETAGPPDTWTPAIAGQTAHGFPISYSTNPTTGSVTYTIDSPDLSGYATGDVIDVFGDGSVEYTVGTGYTTGSATGTWPNPPGTTPVGTLVAPPGTTRSSELVSPTDPDYTATKTLNATNEGTAWAGVGQITDPSKLTGNTYIVAFNVAPAAAEPAPIDPDPANWTLDPVITYDVYSYNPTTDPQGLNAAKVLSDQPYTSGQDITFDGMSIAVQGDPADGDSIVVQPSQSTDLFSVLDQAIAAIDGAKSDNELAQNLANALAQIDSGISRISTARSQAGALLNQADLIDNMQSAKKLQLASDRSTAEDMDMVQGISDFSNMQTGYQAALQTYSALQKLSLFNYM